MNIKRLSRPGFAVAFGALALLGGALATRPALAQDAGTTTTEPTKAISLNLVNVPVQAALRTLFSSAGIRNYSIKSDVQGFANINVSEVPFSLALRQLLSSVNPPLSYTVDNGTYIVSVQQAAAPVPLPAPPFGSGPTGPSTDPNSGATGGDTTSQPKRFYRIPIDKYDAFVIAKLLADTGKIIQVPINIVVPSAGGGAGGGNGGQNGGFGGGLTSPVTTVGGSGFGGGGRFGGGGYGGSSGGSSGGNGGYNFGSSGSSGGSPFGGGASFPGGSTFGGGGFRTTY